MKVKGVLKCSVGTRFVNRTYPGVYPVSLSDKTSISPNIKNPFLVTNFISNFSVDNALKVSSTELIKLGVLDATTVPILVPKVPLFLKSLLDNVSWKVLSIVADPKLIFLIGLSTAISLFTYISNLLSGILGSLLLYVFISGGNATLNLTTYVVFVNISGL